jgi:hypothetical protein
MARKSNEPRHAGSAATRQDLCASSTGLNAIVLNSGRRVKNDRVHPAAVVERLIQECKISPNCLDTYNVRQIETKETTLEEHESLSRSAAKVVPLKGKRPTKKGA